MFFSIAALAVSLLFGFAPHASSDAGGTMDPNGTPSRATSSAPVSSDQGGGLDPDGKPSRAAASSDQGGATDPDGKPQR